MVTDLGGAQGLAEYDITEADQMFKVMRSQVDVVLPGGAAVLNAADAAQSPGWPSSATAR